MIYIFDLTLSNGQHLRYEVLAASEYHATEMAEEALEALEETLEA